MAPPALLSATSRRDGNRVVVASNWRTSIVRPTRAATAKGIHAWRQRPATHHPSGRNHRTLNTNCAQKTGSPTDPAGGTISPSSRCEGGGPPVHSLPGCPPGMRDAKVHGALAPSVRPAVTIAQAADASHAETALPLVWGPWDDVRGLHLRSRWVRIGSALAGTPRPC